MVEMMLFTLVFLPFPAGLLAYALGFTGKGSEKEMAPAGRFAALAMVILEFLIALYLFVQFFLSSVGVSVSLTEQTVEAFLANVCGFGLRFQMDGFRAVYAFVAALMWMMTALLSGEYFKHHKNTQRFYMFLLFTLGATEGVFLSADLYTTFIFFEVMSFTSYVWVAQEENRPSLQAAATYLAVAVIGGLVMLMGIFLLYHETGTLLISALPEAVQNCSDMTVIYIAGGCMLFGFGAKAGAFPLHIWLPKAHPVAPAPASALLSGILTKTGIYGILILSCNLFLADAAWASWILGIGVVTMFGGALLAVFSIDLKRTLACSSMSQIGFILVGAGMHGLLGEENALAANGTFLHMINHSLIKLVLFMAAGVIYMNTHKLDLNSIRGYGRKKTLLKLVFLTGALAIAGVPFFGGYASKTLLHEAILEYGGGSLMIAVEWIFLVSGGMTVAYMTKLYLAIFVEKNADEKLQETYDSSAKYWNGTTCFALTVSAALLFVWGLIPNVTMDRVAKLGQSFLKVEENHLIPYLSLENLKGAAISILIGAAIYLLFIRKVLIRQNEGYVNLWPKWLDLENLLYRPLLLTILPVFFGILCRVLDSAVDTLVVLLRKTIYKDSPLPYEHTEAGNLFTHLFGRMMNGFESVENIFRKEKRDRDYVVLLAQWNEDVKENNRIIGRSLSYGLMLFGVGLMLTLVYLIWW